MNIAGTRLPGGRYRINAAEDAVLRRAVGSAPDPNGRAHSIYYYIASQVGMGISVEDLLKLCDFDVADGPLMAGSEVVFDSELRVDTDYEVEGEIASLVRKPSRSFGAVDLLSFTLTLREGRSSVLRCTHHWVLPRRTGAAA